MTSQPPPPEPIPYASPGVYRQPPRRFMRGLFGWVLFIGLAVMLFLVLQTKDKSASNVALSEFFNQLNNGNVVEIVIDGDTLRALLRRPVPLGTPTAPTKVIRTDLPPTTAQSWAFLQSLLQHQASPTVRVENNQSLLVNLLLPLVPWLLIFGFIWFFVFRQLRNRSTTPTATPVYMVPPPEQK